MNTRQPIDHEIDDTQRLPRHYPQHSPRQYMSRQQMDDDTVVLPAVTDCTFVIPEAIDDTFVIPAVTGGPAPDKPRTRHRIALASLLLIASAGVAGYYVVDAGADAPLGNSAVPDTPPRVPPPPDSAEFPPLQPVETTPSPTDHTVHVPIARNSPSAASPRQSPSPSRSPSARPSSASPSPSAPGSPSPSPAVSTPPTPSPNATPGIPDHEDHEDHGGGEQTALSAILQRIRAMLQEP